MAALTSVGKPPTVSAASTTTPAASAQRETGAPTAAPTKQPMTKPVTARPAAEHPISLAQETGEPSGGAGEPSGVLASDELASEDTSATIETAKMDVKAPDELESKDKSATTVIVKTDLVIEEDHEEDRSATEIANTGTEQLMIKPVTSGPSGGLPEQPMRLGC